MLAARANRAGGGRGTRRASEHATKVPLSKKCKLDIKRKHLRGCQSLRGSLYADSYAVNLQLQIDGTNYPEVYKCTIKKHVNNKTSCVSYRLQGTGIYNHLRGLYMRGFAGGEDGVVLLVASTQAAPDLAYADASDGEDDGTMAGAALAIARAGAAAAGSDSEQQQARQRRPQRPRRQQRKRRRDDTDDEEDDEEAAARLAQEEEDEEEEHHGGAETSGRGRAVADGRGRVGSYSAQRRSKHQRLQSHPVHLDSLSPGSPNTAAGDDGEVDPHARHHAGTAAVPMHMHPELHPHSLAGPSGLMPHAHPHLAGGDDASAAAGLGGGGLVQQFPPPMDPLGRGGGDGGVGSAGLEAAAGPFDDVAIGMGLGVGLGGLGGLADAGALLHAMAEPGVGPGGGLPGGLLAMGRGAGGSGGGAAHLQVAAGAVAVADMHPSLAGPGPQHAGIPGMSHAGDDFGGGPHNHHNQHQHHQHQHLHANQHQQQPPVEPQPPPMLAPPSPQLPPLSLSPFSPRIVQALMGRGGAHQQVQQTVNAFGGPLDFEQGWPGRQLNYVDPWA
ncbi:hypothetical protein HYH02_000042 [Chlamydomonas schloesseri]|uniref:Uncharacterized protein n=1 Tax=Chlamydomonas schloesseri TaxID=2026947 RepID=A0A835WLH6_9CHLO|nr:hypothetical protein HYH02_000042 [Chlamydomonas schloesseri]|eukprot:KAG2449938.1 hypothetical protein HYH02_000042 [Chlamydomonas schloesseri]